jgi:hypothetical protein
MIFSEQQTQQQTQQQIRRLIDEFENMQKKARTNLLNDFSKLPTASQRQNSSLISAELIDFSSIIENIVLLKKGIRDDLRFAWDDKQSIIDAYSREMLGILKSEVEYIYQNLQNDWRALFFIQLSPDSAKPKTLDGWDTIRKIFVQKACASIIKHLKRLLESSKRIDIRTLISGLFKTSPILVPNSPFKFKLNPECFLYKELIKIQYELYKPKNAFVFETGGKLRQVFTKKTQQAQQIPVVTRWGSTFSTTPWNPLSYRQATPITELVRIDDRTKQVNLTDKQQLKLTLGAIQRVRKDAAKQMHKVHDKIQKTKLLPDFGVEPSCIKSIAENIQKPSAKQQLLKNYIKKKKIDQTLYDNYLKQQQKLKRKPNHNSTTGGGQTGGGGGQTGGGQTGVVQTKESGVSGV